MHANEQNILKKQNAKEENSDFIPDYCVLVSQESRKITLLVSNSKSLCYSCTVSFPEP